MKGYLFLQANIYIDNSEVSVECKMANGLSRFIDRTTYAPRASTHVFCLVTALVGHFYSPCLHGLCLDSTISE